MYKILFLFALFFQTVDANKIDYDFFENKPRSLAKDFYISRYLDQNISSKEAKTLLCQVKNLNWKLFYKFADKIDDFSFKRAAYCKKLKASEFLGKDADCVKIGLSLYKASTLDPQTLKNIADTIEYKYPKNAYFYKLLAKREFKNLKSDDFLTIFNQIGKKFQKKYFDFPLSDNMLLELIEKKGFNTAVNKIVRNRDLKALQKSILKIDSSKLNADSNFLLALNALKQNRADIAKWYLKLSYKKSFLRYGKDRALFWLYLINREKDMLKRLLLESKEINFYTLFAYEKLSLTPKNIFVSIDPKQKNAPFDITDPFIWLKIKKKFKNEKFKDFRIKKEAALRLNSLYTEPHVASLIYRYKDHKHYYLFSYREFIKNLPLKRQALIFAIARQESRLIPTAVSYSYALGLMQFMPFVAKAIADEEDIKNFRYEDLFDPKTAMKFAKIHLDFLQKKLLHPLFIAYAYNAGAGYTKRNILLNKEYFQDKEYEPFLSIELLPNAQAREYGKKVLTNYVIYSKLLDIKDVSLLKLLKELRKKRKLHLH